MVKFLFLFLSALMSVASVQAAGLPEINKVVPRLKPVNVTSSYEAVLEKVKPVAPVVGNRIPEQVVHRLDSVVGYNPDGSKGKLQKFVYKDGWWTEYHNYYWSPDLNSWGEPVESFVCTRMENGNIISERNMSYGYGVRNDYEYDASGNGIKMTSYNLSAGSDEWIPTSKGEYVYDDNNNIIEEYTYVWDGENWVYSAHNMATWDEKKRQTSIESYEWNGSSWSPGQKIDYRWFDGPYDPDYVEGTEKERMVYRCEYMIIDGKWLAFFVDENEFNDDGRIVSQSQKYYNRQYNNWYGGDNLDGRLYLFNSWKSKIGYDDRGIQNENRTFMYVPGSEEKMYELGHVEYTEYPQKNGDFIILEVNQNNVYDDNGEVTGTKLLDKLWTGYNSDRKKLWVYEEMPTADGTLVPMLESKYAYDENGNQTEVMHFDYEDNARVPNNWASYTFDEDGNNTSVIGHVNAGGGMSPLGAPRKVEDVDFDYLITDNDRNDNWQYTNKWEYEYDNGMQVKRRGYTWRDSKWTNNQGQNNNFDFSVTLENMFVPQMYTDLYKVDSIEYLYGDGDSWVSTEDIYYYTGINTGVDAVVNERGVSYDGTMVRTDDGMAADIYVSDLSGMTVLSAHAEGVSTESLAAGVYIVTVTNGNGCGSFKILVK